MVRRNGLLVGGWTLATLLALVLGLQGIRSVSNSVTSPRPASLSAASVKAAVQHTNSVAPTTSTQSVLPPAGEAVDDSSGPQTGPRGGTEAGHNDGGAAPSFTAPPAPNDASDASTSSSISSGPQGGGDGSSSSDGTGSASSSSAPPTAAQDVTYQLVGGSVGIRFENGAAHLLWATPNTGFNVETSSDDGTVDVRFRSEDHESRLRAYWDNGPQREIEESSSGGD